MQHWKKKVWAQDLRLFSVLLIVLTYFSTTVASGMEALGTTEVEEGSSEVERWRLRLLELRRKESLSLLEPERVSTGSSGGGLIFTLAWRERPEPNLEEENPNSQIIILLLVAIKLEFSFLVKKFFWWNTQFLTCFWGAVCFRGTWMIHWPWWPASCTEPHTPPCCERSEQCSALLWWLLSQHPRGSVVWWGPYQWWARPAEQWEDYQPELWLCSAYACYHHCSHE